MKILKNSLLYFAYILFSIAFSMYLVYLEIDGRPNSKLAGLFHDFIILTVGTILGLIAATLFFLLNYSLLKKSKSTFLENKTVLQIVLLILSCLIVHEIHQILEFDLDIL